jgi:hypothetical protein
VDGCDAALAEGEDGVFMWKIHDGSNEIASALRASQ